MNVHFQYVAQHLIKPRPQHQKSEFNQKSEYKNGMRAKQKNLNNYM